MRGRQKSHILIPATSLLAFGFPRRSIRLRNDLRRSLPTQRLISKKWPTTLVVCSSINDIFRSKITKNPPLGTLPIIIRKAEDAIPRVDLRGLPNAYWVNLTALTRTIALRSSTKPATNLDTFG